MPVARALIALTLLLSVSACEDSAPPAGAGCESAGGVCTSATCPAFEAFPCPASQHCCLITPGADAGSG